VTSDGKLENLGGGQLVARALKKEGVTHIFTLCGGHITPIYMACHDGTRSRS